MEQMESRTEQMEETREGRGIILARERADEFERVAPFVWMVPSCTGDVRYSVDLDLLYCNCTDYQIHRERGIKNHVCEHMIAAEIVSVKRRHRREEREEVAE